MRNPTRLIVAALVGGASLAAALPAQAQSWQQHNRYDDRRDDDYRHDRWDDGGQANAIRTQIEQLQRRVERTDSRDRISEREAASLRRAVYNLRQQYRDYARNGLNRREAQILQSRINEVRQRLGYERRDRDGRNW